MDQDARHNAIWQLSQMLSGHRLEAVMHATEPQLSIAGDAADGHRVVEVRCDQRVEDGGRLWFYTDPGGQGGFQPAAETTRPTDAITRILGERRIRM
jgi:hypothetical protein